MEKKIATFLTYILHPLLAPIAGIFILTRSGTYIADLNPEIINLITLIVITLTLVLPVCLIPFYLYFKMIRQVSIPENHERLIPMIITLVAYLGAWFLIRRLPGQPALQPLPAGCMFFVADRPDYFLLLENQSPHDRTGGPCRACFCIITETGSGNDDGPTFADHSFRPGRLCQVTAQCPFKVTDSGRISLSGSDGGLFSYSRIG